MVARTQPHPVIAALVAITAMTSSAAADGGPTATVATPLAGLVPHDDARQAIAIGPSGEVYRPRDGGWVRVESFAIAQGVEHVARIGGAPDGGTPVVSADGVVYRLAPTGWSVLRIANRSRSTLGIGAQAVAAVGRQLYALDRLSGGEPAKLAVAPGAVSAIASGVAVPGGAALAIATPAGIHRVERGRVTPLKRAPRVVQRLVSDRWALVDRGPVDLASGAVVPWPAELRVVIASAGPGDTLVAVAANRAALELVTVHPRTVATKRGVPEVQRDPVPAIGGAEITGTPVGVVADRDGRATIALADGRILSRDALRTWSVVTARVDLGPPRPGPAPAVSGAAHGSGP